MTDRIDFGKMRKSRTPQSEIERLQKKVAEFDQRIIDLKAEKAPQRLIDGIIGRRRNYQAEIKAWMDLI